MLPSDISSESDLVYLASCCLPRPFSSFFLIREVDTWGLDWDLEKRQRREGLLVGWDNIGLLAVLHARQGIVYAATPAFWHNLESFRGFLVATPMCISHSSRLLARDNTSLRSRVCGLAMLEFVVLRIDAFFRTVCYGVVPMYSNAKIPYEID